MFDKILIANRGEIACRIARTCRELGIRTVAVYSEADTAALHVERCDEAVLLGPAPARDSYLDIGRILDAARRSGAQAIHPGYGFLSENAEFAAACEEAGIVFIGPPAAAIRAMGSKSAAKAIMAEAGVPVVPGYHGDDQSPELLAREAAAIGYPVLIKASAGGGGKGMRRVDRPEQFAEALAGAKREAWSGFGDDRVLIEKYLLAPRHIEIQVFADRHGGAVHLFERDCSVQRRHQKVLEEAPAPGLSAATRAAMGEAAVAAARAIGYVGAGTVEFIMDADGRFYFMEMNTRLQVEHPVTELITGQDLVAWQLAVAAGAPLPVAQQDLAIHGHAMEARIYAEDPAREFLPATGVLHRLREPARGDQVRIDSGVREGDAVTPHYDPLLAKLIVWGPDRSGALARLRRALGDYLVVGCATNLPFLARVAAHPAFAAGGVDTGFIDSHRDALLAPPAAAGERAVAAAALHLLLEAERAAACRAAASADPWSPWHHASGFRLNGDNWHELRFTDGEQELTVIAHFRRDGYLLELPTGALRAQARPDGNGRVRITLNGAQFDAELVEYQGQLTVAVDGDVHTFGLLDAEAAAHTDALHAGGLRAPMPGLVRAVLVEAGQAVAAGDPLVVLEAMKMEYTIRAAEAGVVAQLNVAAGEQVADGAELLVVTPQTKGDA